MTSLSRDRHAENKHGSSGLLITTLSIPPVRQTGLRRNDQADAIAHANLQLYAATAVLPLSLELGLATTPYLRMWYCAGGSEPCISAARSGTPDPSISYGNAPCGGSSATAPSAGGGGGAAYGPAYAPGLLYAGG